MTEIFHYNLSSEDAADLSPRTSVKSLRVKTYQAPDRKREVVFWFNREDVPNPEIVYPGIRMYVRSFEEVSPNKFLLKAGDGRNYKLELLYVE